MTENQIEHLLIEKLTDLKYAYRPDIRDRAALEANFRRHFEELNRVHLTDSEFGRRLEDIDFDRAPWKKVYTPDKQEQAEVLCKDWTEKAS